MKSACAICCLIVFISGCAVHDAELKSDIVNSDSKTSLVHDTDWWKAYNDPNLDAVIAIALERNTDLAKAAITASKAFYKANQMGADLLPSFNASGNAQSRLSTPTGSSTRSFSASFGLSYEIDLWGRLRDSASASEWEYHASESDMQAARLSLINSVINTYYGLAYSTQALIMSEKILHFYERLHSIMKNKFEAGKEDSLSIAQTEQSLLSQKKLIINLKASLEDEKTTFRNLLDLKPDEPLPTVQADMLSVVPPVPDLDIPIQALSTRPDVRASENRLRSAFCNLNAARKDLYPSISIGGTIGASSSQTSQFFKSSWLNGLIQINLPFLDWNRMKWHIKISEKSFEEAKLAFQKSLTTALNELHRYRLSINEADMSLANAQERHRNDKRIAEYRRIRYEQGADELRIWLDALRTAAASELDILSARFDRISAANALFQAMGGTGFKRHLPLLDEQ